MYKNFTVYFLFHTNLKMVVREWLLSCATAEIGLFDFVYMAELQNINK